MSRRWTGRGSGLVIGYLLSAITLLGASAPRAFADTPPIDTVTTTVDASSNGTSAAVDDVVTSDNTDQVQETSVGESVEATTDPATAETPDTLIEDTGATGTTDAAPDAVPDGTSQGPVGVTDAASETPEAPQEAPQAVEATVADVASATTDEDAATNAITAAPDSVTERTRSDTIAESSDATADATTGTISAGAGADEQPSLDATAVASATTTDVAAMITDASTEATDVVETPEATDGTGPIADATSEVATAIGDTTVEAVSMVESLATVLDTAASATDLTSEISTDVTAVGDMGSGTAPAAVETISDTAGMMTDGAAEAVMSAEAITETAVREATAIAVEPSAVIDAAADATWGTSETVATEASATVSNAASLETVTATATSGATDITALLGQTATEALVTLAEAAADTVPETAVTILDAVTKVPGTADPAVGMASEITSESVGAGPDGTSNPVTTTLSSVASAGIAAVGGDGGLADPMAALKEATETVVSGLDPAGLGGTEEASEATISGQETSGHVWRIQGESSSMRNELISLSRGQTGGERFQGNEPVDPCEDASSPNCGVTGGADGIDSLVESVASIIKILALTGLTLLPWVAAAGMLASLGGFALAASRRRRITGSAAEATLPRGSHVKDAWAYS